MNILIFIITLISVLLQQKATPLPKKHVLSTHVMPLNDRYSVPSVNDVFKDNILLNLAYLRGTVKPGQIDWNTVEKPFHYTVTLQPNEAFAFHDDVLPEFDGKVKVTTNAHFNATEGFKSDGYLFGDGVCHLASLLGWTAKDAKLAVVAPTNHDFANIPDVPKEYGVAIYNAPGEKAVNSQENLYITNNLKKPVELAFDYQGDTLRVTASEIN